MRKSKTKGILLAGGSGTRLRPVTVGVSVQCLFMTNQWYITHLQLYECGITDILLISTPVDLPIYKRLLGDGSQFE